METDAGDWTNRSFADVIAEAPELFAAFANAEPDFAFPGGESFAEQEERVGAALDDDRARARCRRSSSVTGWSSAPRSSVRIGRWLPNGQRVPNGAIVPLEPSEAELAEIGRAQAHAGELSRSARARAQPQDHAAGAACAISFSPSSTNTRPSAVAVRRAGVHDAALGEHAPGLVAHRADVAHLQVGRRVADARRQRRVHGAAHARVEDRRRDRRRGPCRSGCTSTRPARARRRRRPCSASTISKPSSSAIGGGGSVAVRRSRGCSRGPPASAPRRPSRPGPAS